MLEAGTYVAKVTGECVLGESKTKGTPFLEFYLTVKEGDSKGQRARWTGYFTENTNERSIQSLQHCGWAGDDLSEFADGELHGLDTNDVEIVVEHEEYEVVDKETGQKTGEVKKMPRVAWINKAGGFLNKAAAMNPNAAAAFGAKMRGLVHKVKEASPQAAASAKPNATGAPKSSEADNADPIPF